MKARQKCDMYTVFVDRLYYLLCNEAKKNHFLWTLMPNYADVNDIFCDFDDIFLSKLCYVNRKTHSEKYITSTNN